VAVEDSHRPSTPVLSKRFDSVSTGRVVGSIGFLPPLGSPQTGVSTTGFLLRNRVSRAVAMDPLCLVVGRIRY